MSGTRSAVRYAKAIMEIASDKKLSEVINQDMALISSTIAKNKELKDFIVNPTVSVEDKKNSLDQIFASTNKLTQHLFQLLLVNNRFEILEAVSQQYGVLYNSANNIQIAQVTTAFPITPALEKQVLAKIATFSDKKIAIENIVDDSIIGGFILRIEDQQYNASVANKLRTLSRELRN